MKALTVRQPWIRCTLEAEDYPDLGKLIENRSRAVSHRGPLALHAAATWSREGASDPRVVALLDRWRYPHERGKPVDAAGGVPMLLRHVVAVVDLTDCHRANGCCTPWGDPTGWHLVFASVRRLTVPFPTVGRLGLWDVDDEQIRAAM